VKRHLHHYFTTAFNLTSTLLPEILTIIKLHCTQGSAIVQACKFDTFNQYTGSHGFKKK